jgi:hypothetical protein
MTTCAESGLAIKGRARALPLVEVNAVWQPLALPLVGTHDERGGLVEVDMDEIALATTDGLHARVTFAQPPASHNAGGLLAALAQGATLDGRNVGYALLDDRIYRALAVTIEGGGRPEWENVSTAALEGLDVAALSALAFGDAYTFYASLGERDALKSALCDLARVRAFGTQLQPVSLHDVDSARAIAAARERYQGMPIVLGAVDANEGDWRS